MYGIFLHRALLPCHSATPPLRHSAVCWCGVAEQTVKHLCSRFRKLRRQRRKLVRELAKEVIKWQPQVEGRRLAGLLGDEKAVAPLLKFLRTGIGGREGAREKELEWEQKSVQAGENLLG